MHNLKVLTVIGAVIIVVILYFGLRFKDYSLVNQVAWLEKEAGIRLDKYGVVFTRAAPRPTSDGGGRPAAFSMEMAFEPASFQTEGFNLILSLHGGRDSEQLIVGQYNSHLIVMNGDDYDNKKRTPKFYYRFKTPEPETVFLHINGGTQTTAVFIDGHGKRVRSGFTLSYPKGERLSLALGNSVYGEHSWRGDIYGLVFYDKVVPAQQVQRRFTAWAASNNFAFAAHGDPIALYAIDEKRGTRIHDRAGKNAPLEMPHRMEIIVPHILSMPWHVKKVDRALIVDSVVNLTGFIPLGLVLSVWLQACKGPSARYIILLPVVFCFGLSLVMEIGQAWIPSRSSSMLDLAFNTLGAWMGAAVFFFWKRKDLSQRT